MQMRTGFLTLSAAVLSFSAPLLGQTLTCSSDDGKRHYCNADTHQGVEMLRQRSGSPCTQGYSWGYDGRGIWVDHGCRADFSLQTTSSARVVTCSSDDGGRHYCDADTRAGVQLIRQRSGSPCTQGETWGFDDRGIWVDRGCRGDFALEAGPDGYPSHDDLSRPPQNVTCASEDGKRHYCDAD